MRRKVRVVQTIRKRVPIASVYAVPNTERWLNVGLLAATPAIDLAEIKDAAWRRLYESERKK